MAVNSPGPARGYRLPGWTDGKRTVNGGAPALKIRPCGAYARPHKSRSTHKLRYGSIKVKIMYEICLLIILSAGSGRLPLSRSCALRPLCSIPLSLFLFPRPAVMPFDQTRARSRYPNMRQIIRQLYTVMKFYETVILLACVLISFSPFYLSLSLFSLRVSLSEFNASLLPMDAINQTRYQ